MAELVVAGTVAPWAQGLTMAERIPLAEPESAADRDRALRRLARWKRAHDLAEGGGFAALLATLPGGEEWLLGLLGEPAEALARRAGKQAGTPPGWWHTAWEALTGAGEVSREAGEPADWPHDFAIIVAPFARHALRELAGRLRADPVREEIESQPLLAEFLFSLNGQLVALAARTLVLELNVLRVQGRLPGETPGERFGAFVAHFTGRAGREALFAEYPVLARLLVQRAETNVEAAWEFFQRWRDDREVVVTELLGGVEPGRITSVRFGLGDPHAGGRSVALVEFAGGARVVYKPRPLGAHVRFNALLHWFDGAAGGLGVRRLAVVDRGEYGWVEYVKPAECTGAAEFGRYYHRLGALMALLHTVDGADFHFENLVAAGDQPVLVDLETVFHQRMPVMAGSAQQDDPALRALESSVSRVGLLPIVVSGAGGTVDLGGLGGDPSTATPFAAAAWAEDGTDTMHVVREHVAFPGGQNRPSAAGVAANPLRYVDDLVAGFRVGYQAILDRRAELEPLLDSFADVEVRTVLRTTQTYGTLLNEGSHPDLLRDALDMDRHFSLLWAVCPKWPELARLVPYELADLWAGDIPLFTTRPGSRDLWTSGGERLPEFFAETGLARARAKLNGLGEVDRRRQEWIIRATLVTRPDAMTVAPPTPDRPADVARGNAAAYLAAAREIGDRLVEAAVRDDAGRVGWLGLEPAGDSRWQVGPLRWDLYSGYTGVALFLHRLAGLTATPAYGELAAAALWALPETLAELEGVPAEQLAAQPGVGGMNGLPGLAYGLVHLGQIELAERVARLCGALVDGDEALDILDGCAGAIGALLAVHAHTGSPAALDVARRCGKRLCDKAVAAGDGLAWATVPGLKRPMTGFSHGAAGMGWALVRLGAAVGEQRFVDTGLAAFRYERGEYRPEWENWPDHRELGGQAGHMYAWCHGAPGIGLARASVLSVLEDPGVRDDLTAALVGTVHNGFGQNHSLCHGDLGNAELLLAAGDPNGRLAAIGGAVLASLAAGPPRCGTPGEVETPALMIGMAGIGYGLLRLAAPERVPSILLAQPPTCA